MGFKNKKKRIAFCLLALLLVVHNSPAQEKEQADSLVRLLSASLIEQYESGDDLIRKAIKPTFLHNGTYLKCDTSYWSENDKLINCIGNVSLSQGDTELTSEKLDYLIDQDLAQFRGSLVELKDKKGNILRTNILDYNTKDSIAVFIGGASMISEDGQIIESVKGRYLNAEDLFKFNQEVNMYADSVFIKTDSLLYHSETKRAHFISYIDFFKDENMLSSKRGWFDSDDDIFFLNGSVHGLGKTQEIWCDTLYYYRKKNDILLLGNAQVQDSSRKAASLSDYLFYEDSLSRVTLKNRAAIALWEENEERKDTTYLGSEVIVYQGIKKCEIDSLEKVKAAERKKTIMADPIEEFRRRSSAEAARKAEEAKKKSDEEKGKRPLNRVDSSLQDKSADEVNTEQIESPDTSDSLALEKEALDTTLVGFITAVGKVKAYRNDMQMVSDSMVFSELDSIARFYIDPLVWNEGRRQYSSDSLFILTTSKGMDRASLMGNAFITIQEPGDYFDQIRSSEVMAYFDTTAALRRFDALGGVSALFCIEENDVIATINKVEGRTLTATLENGELQKAYYFESPRNDASPAAQISEADKKIKGFKWNPELKPNSKDDITTLNLKPSERSSYERHPHAEFNKTDKYFPGYMEQLYSALEEIRIKREQSRREAPQTDTLSQSDTLNTPKDSIVTEKDSINVKIDSLSSQIDSLSPQIDSLSTAPKDSTKYMSEKELRKALRIAQRDARWAEQDKKDAERLSAKQAKMKARAEKKEERRQKLLKRQAAKDKKLYDKYYNTYSKQKERNEARRKESDTSRERTEGIEAGGGVQAPVESTSETFRADSLFRNNGTVNDSLVLGSRSIPRT